MDKLIPIAGEYYYRHDAEALRERLIEKRNDFLGPEKFDAHMAVIFSHTIALLAVAIPVLYAEVQPEKKEAILIKQHVDLAKESRANIMVSYQALKALHETEVRRFSLASDSFRSSDYGKDRQNRIDLLGRAVADAHSSALYTELFLKAVGEEVT